MEISRLGGGVFTIDGFLGAEECRAYIALSEDIGFEEATISTAAGDRLLKEARNNDRILLDRPDIADPLYQRARPLLPAQLDGWQLCGFNERMRFYRYDRQQFFRWHQDGTFRRSDHEESLLTFMIYLNDGFEGGDTLFRWEAVRPRAGRALVFPHRLSHQGSAVTAGHKYVLRTDVMYRDGAAF
jgi:hypothetical protein